MKTHTKLTLVTFIVFSLLMTPALALAGPTELTFNWDGFGAISIDFTADDDASSIFDAVGNTKGTFYAKDSDNNPYGYGVDNFIAELEAEIDGGGFLDFKVNRTDSKESMYGSADQSTRTWLYSDDTGLLNFRTSTNYANLRSSNYGWHSSNNFVADAGSGVYELQHSVTNGDNFASLYAIGDGTVNIDHMSDDVGNTNIKFGRGCGCFTNADATFTGSGLFRLNAHYENSMSMGGWSANGPVDWTQTWSFGDGFTINDYSFEGN